MIGERCLTFVRSRLTIFCPADRPDAVHHCRLPRTRNEYKADGPRRDRVSERRSLRDVCAAPPGTCSAHVRKMVLRAKVARMVPRGRRAAGTDSWQTCVARVGCHASFANRSVSMGCWVFEQNVDEVLIQIMYRPSHVALMDENRFHLSLNPHHTRSKFSVRSCLQKPIRVLLSDTV